MNKKQRRVRPEKVLNVYPRPQMKRESFICLNGFWDYSITEEEDIPEVYDGKICVPFPVESKASNVGRKLNKHKNLWYHRELKLEEEEIGNGRLLLHFGAISSEAWVYINGFLVAHHLGGYLPFAVDLTEYVSADNDLYVKVKNTFEERKCSRGAQTEEDLIQSGIWQTVWMEKVPERYIKSVKITPLFDECAVEILVISDSNYLCTAHVNDKSITFQANRRIIFSLENVTEWTPEYPYLYKIKIEMEEDLVESYFGMRKISIDKDRDGVTRIFLNNRPYFMNGVLDTGYNYEGDFTPLSDRAMIYDIFTAKKMGFNMIHKSMKIEPLRWYYHCDRMGMIVWQDIPTGPDNSKAGTKTYENHQNFGYELEGMVRTLYNSVSILSWVLPSCSYGKYDSIGAFRSMLEKDKTRLINTSNYNKNNTSGDMKNIKLKTLFGITLKDKNDRALVAMDIGNFECKLKDKYGTELTKRMTRMYRNLYRDKVWRAYKNGLSAVVFSQLADDKKHLCGIMTKDRKLSKLSRSAIKSINKNFTSKICL